MPFTTEPSSSPLALPDGLQSALSLPVRQGTGPALRGHLREEPHCFTSVPWLSFLSPQSRQRARNTAAASVTGMACSCPRQLLKAGNASLTCAVVTHFRRSLAEVFSRLSALWQTTLPSTRSYFLFLSPLTNAVFCPLNLELSTRHGCDHIAPLTSAI